MSIIVIYVAIAAVFLIFMQRRGANNRRRQQDQNTHLVVGAEVRTIGGMLGTVVEVDDDSVTIETTPGVKLRFIKTAIAGISSSPAFETPAQDGLAESDETDEQEAVDAAPETDAIESETDSAQEGDAVASSDDNVPAGESVLSASDKK